jgi:SAM-dependent methyltransferase
MFRKYELPDLDDPNTSLAHREIILKKPFLRRWYTGWYNQFAELVNKNPGGNYLELGSGGGFMKQVVPQVITSDIMSISGIDQVVNAESLPFGDQSLNGIFMLNVFHHIPNPELFLAEAERTLRSGGRVVMVEPASTAFSRFIYKRFHHEPFDEHGSRQIKAGHPLSNSNQAMAHIYFERDLEIFNNKFPNLKIRSVKYHTPLMYLMSGGVSRSAFLPGIAFPLVQFAEFLLSPLSKLLGLFCTVIIEKK